MMQQIAPGKFKMTHYAFATAFMNLVLVPTQMASGPLADSMGFKSFFFFVFVAAVPSLAAAWFAPFPQTEAKDDDTSVDDEERLNEDEKKMQAAARHATILALLSAALFLYPDILSIGWMSSTQSGAWLAFFLLLIAFTNVVKVVLALRAIAAGRSALALAPRFPRGRAYLSNAKGAIIGGAVMIGVSAALTWVVIDKAISTDWSCAFSETSAQCLKTETEHVTECSVPTINRQSAIWAGFRGLF
jgi:PAT family beta-lactamase induction signal transducer AmpG